MFRGLNEKKCSNARAYVVRKYNVKTYEKQNLAPEHPRIATLLISEHLFEKNLKFSFLGQNPYQFLLLNILLKHIIR